MKILVTGGAGFIGTNLIKSLLDGGHEVVSWDNYSTGLSTNCIDHKNVQYHDKDITKLSGSFNENHYDVVYHLAAIARIQPSFDKPVDYFDTNATATMKLAKMCADANIPLIYAGSSSHHSGKYKNPYTFSKTVGEEVLEMCHKNFGLRYCIARFYNVYGPHQLTEGDYTTLIGRWIHNIENDKISEIYGTGQQRRDFTHVDDIVDGLLMLHADRYYDGHGKGDPVELGCGVNWSVDEVAAMFEKVTDKFKWKRAASKSGEAVETLSTKSRGGHDDIPNFFFRSWNTKEKKHLWPYLQEYFGKTK